METTREITWRLTTGGIMNYCATGQHFTTGPVWQAWQGLVSKMCVCDECAQKEAS